jgi:isoquinoline 1-oxidoreductase
MNEQPFYSLEPERYELHGDEMFWELDRRELFRRVGAGIVVALLLSKEELALAQEGRPGRPRFGQPLPQEIGAWLHIGADGVVTGYTGKVELGQNIRTSLTQVIADELRLPLDRIRLVMADTALVPFDMGTFGSQTTPTMAGQLRRVAAATRELLLDLAAEKGLERRGLTVKDGKVVEEKTGKTFDYGALTQGKKLVKVVDKDVATRPAKEWTCTGTSAAKVDGRDFVTGAHRYSSDVHRPGMLFGKVLRPPTFKSRLASARTTAAEGLPGVTVLHEGDFLAVAARTEQEAARALAAIDAGWRAEEEPSPADLFAYLRSHPSQGRGGRGGASGQERGSVADGLKAAAQRRKATYTIAYIAHFPLEPRAAVAEWKGELLTVWTGTQRPFGVRGELAAALKMPADKVHVIVPDTGSGYGGKHTGEAAIEAARLAKAAGKPVKVVWTREEEMTWAYFRPAGVIDVEAGVSRDGVLTAWEMHNYNSGGSALRTPYRVANERSQFHPTESPLRQGSYRALAATANHFAREMHMDELAHACGMDPLAFRLKNLDNERLRAVLEAAAQRLGWGQKAAPGRGVGIAGGTEKGSYVATCAEVQADRAGGPVKVVRLVTAFECGAILNPDHLKNQIEGAVVMGLGGALFEVIAFAGGKILNARLSRYRVPRFADTPLLETVLLDRKDLPSAGAGETPIVAVAPAVGNAVFAATGIRLTSLPMVPGGLAAARQG